MTAVPLPAVPSPAARFARAVRAGAAAAILFAAVAGARAAAQGLDLAGPSDQPVEITADQGIEWHQEEKSYIARGNAAAKRGETTVRSQTLTAYYRPTEEGGTDIYRLDAVGDVAIASPQATAQGDRAVYDVKNGVLVLKGSGLKLLSMDYTVTARDSLEYWDAKGMAVARGEAVVVTGDKRLSADIISAYFARAGAGPEGDGASAAGAGKQKPAGGRIQRIEAFGNVRVSQPGQIALGERGVYDAETGIARLYGSVRITRGENQINGEYGEVNLNTGVAKMLSGAPGAGTAGPVRGLFTPKKKPEIAPAAPAAGQPAPPAAQPQPAPPSAKP